MAGEVAALVQELTGAERVGFCNTGSEAVLAANIGSRERTAYSLIGDTVNTASRIQGMNKLFGTEILVSGNIVEKAGKEFEFVRMPDTALKGKNRPVTIFSLAGRSGNRLHR